MKVLALASYPIQAAATRYRLELQREAMMFGPPLVEWLIARVLACPMVLDLDDATYVSYTSPTYGGIGKALKWFGKTDDLIRWANIVVCGNDAIAAYVANKGARARIVPTIVDTEVFSPGLKDKGNEKLVLGWIGTHSTYPYLESIFPVIQQLSSDHSILSRRSVKQERRIFVLQLMKSGIQPCSH